MRKGVLSTRGGASTTPRRPTRLRCAGGAAVVVVGGGNSAGQAAVYLGGHASRVLLLVRGDDLYKNMSTYLARRIDATSNIEVCCNTTIRRLVGDGYLAAVETVNSETG